MSLHHIANHLASKGRNGDSTLVHMTKGEVAGLQALAKSHGKSLTINPQTGLPEAFSLKSLLPLAAGFMLGGPLGMSAMASGLTVGGITTLATGSLKQGLMAGLGAYGGAGLGAGTGAASGASQSVTGAGAGAPAPLPEVADVGTAAGSGPVTANPVTQGSVQGTELGSFNESGQAASGFQPSPTTTANGPVYTGVPETSAQTGVDFGGPGSSPSSMGTQTTAARPTYSADTAQSGVDLGGPGSSPANTGAPPSTFNRVVANAEADPKLLAYAAAPGIAEELTPKPYKEPEIKGDADMGQRYAYNSGYSNDIPGRTGPASYSAISNEEARKLYGFAEGGEVGFPGESVIRMADGGAAGYTGGVGDYSAADAAAARGGYGLGVNYSGYDAAPNAGLAALSAAQPAVAAPEYGFAFDPASKQYVGSVPGGEMIYQGGGKYGLSKKGMEDMLQGIVDGYAGQAMAAGGGISTLGGYSDGGRLLKGPGDGMSDNIPAKIGDKQPARLADGEFVVPADVVSHLGNGSTDAGAKQLYKMMDKVRTARTGRKAQGKQVNPDKFLPA